MADRDEHGLTTLEFYVMDVHVAESILREVSSSESILWSVNSRKVKSMEGYIMIKHWIYAALVTDRQIPKGMSSHDARFSFCWFAVRGIEIRY